MQNLRTTTRQAAPLRPYQQVDPQTGQVSSVIRYVEGQPLMMHFDPLRGSFNREGDQNLCPFLNITPVAWRFFEGNLFGRDRARYAELFYVDAANNLTVVLFTGWSAEKLKKFAVSLEYGVASGKTLCNRNVHISLKRTSSSDSGSVYVAEFADAGRAREETVFRGRIFCRDFKIYQAETRERPGVAARINDGWHSASYFTMMGRGVHQAAPATETERARIQAAYAK